MVYDYVRRTYDVDPVPGHRVLHHVTGREGTIRQPHAEDQYVHVCFDGDRHARRCHPMEMDYLGPSGEEARPSHDDDDPINLAGSGPVPIEPRR